MIINTGKMGIISYKTCNSHNNSKNSIFTTNYIQVLWKLLWLCNGVDNSLKESSENEGELLVYGEITRRALASLKLYTCLLSHFLNVSVSLTYCFPFLKVSCTNIKLFLTVFWTALCFDESFEVSETPIKLCEYFQCIDVTPIGFWNFGSINIFSSQAFFFSNVSFKF